MPEFNDINDINDIKGNYDNVLLSTGRFKLIHRLKIDGDGDGFSNYFIVIDWGAEVLTVQQIMTALRHYNKVRIINEIGWRD